jgi:hypothetical protein
MIRTRAKTVGELSQDDQVRARQVEAKALKTAVAAFDAPANTGFATESGTHADGRLPRWENEGGAIDEASTPTP